MDGWNDWNDWNDWKGLDLDLDLCRSSSCVVGVGVVLRGGGLRGERVLGACHVLVRRPDDAYRRLIVVSVLYLGVVTLSEA